MILFGDNVLVVAPKAFKKICENDKSSSLVEVYYETKIAEQERTKPPLTKMKVLRLGETFYGTKTRVLSLLREIVPVNRRSLPPLSVQFPPRHQLNPSCNPASGCPLYA